MSKVIFPKIVTTSMNILPSYDLYILDSQSANITLSLPTIDSNGIFF